VHLGDAQAGRDLGLGEVAVVPQHEDALLTFGQVTEMGVDGLDVGDVLGPFVVRADHVAEQCRFVVI
jgi:hypothetical protein